MSKIDVLALSVGEHVRHTIRTRRVGLEEATNIVHAIRTLARQEGRTVWMTDDETDLHLTAGGTSADEDKLLSLSVDEHVKHTIRTRRVGLEEATNIVHAVRKLARQKSEGR